MCNVYVLCVYVVIWDFSKLDPKCWIARPFRDSADFLSPPVYKLSFGPAARRVWPRHWAATARREALQPASGMGFLRKRAKVCFTCSKEWAEESKNVIKSKKSVLEIQRAWRVWKNFGESQTKEISEHIEGNGLISYDVSWFFPVFSFKVSKMPAFPRKNVLRCIFSTLPWLLGSHWSQLLRSPWPRLGALFWQGKLHLSLLLARNRQCNFWKAGVPAEKDPKQDQSVLTDSRWM